MVDLSIIIPVYYNEGLVRTTFESLVREVIEYRPEYTYEVILIDDGSGDGSLNELIGIQQDYPDIARVIKLTRNFGQVSALLAGFAHSQGRAIVAISADGQEPPHLINEMLDAHMQEGYQVVLCKREGRDESAYRVYTSKVFYWLIRTLSFSNMPPGGFDFFLLSRRALDVLLENEEVHPFLQGQILWMGFTPKFIAYHRLDRKLGESRWTFGKKLTYLIDGVLGYSYFPMRIMSIAGIGAAVLGFLYALVVFVFGVLVGNPVKGWAPLMIVTLVMGGMQMLMLGIIGEYLWRTLAQARQRAPYIIETIYQDVDLDLETSALPTAPRSKPVPAPSAKRESVTMDAADAWAPVVHSQPK